MFKMSLITILLALSSHVQAQFQPEIKPVSFNRVFIPTGFDDNDNVQIVGAGAFHNSCYRYLTTEVEVNHDKKTILLKPHALKYSGACMQVFVPFDAGIDLGILNSGTYSIVNKTDKTTLGHLNVQTAKNANPDEYLYAPVTQAFFDTDNQNTVTLTGEFPISCMELTETRVKIENNVIEVLPITEMTSANKCEKGAFSFKVSVSLPNLEKGQYLLYVRSMNGKSIQSLVRVGELKLF